MSETYIVIAEPSGGTRKRTVSQHFGPASYVAMTTGPVAGGDIVTAQALGLSTIETCNVSDAADDGVHGVVAVLVGKEPKQVTLAWFTTLALAAQVGGAVDLHTFSCRIEATGL